MKKSRFSEQQIAFILRQAEEGTTVEEVCRKAGISEATYYNWRKKYGGLMPSEMKRLKQLEEESQPLSKRSISSWVLACRMSCQSLSVFVYSGAASRTADNLQDVRKLRHNPIRPTAAWRSAGTRQRK